MPASAAEELDLLIRARHTVIAITSYEEERVMDVIRAVAGERRIVAEWSYTTGLKNAPGATNALELRQPTAALEFVSKYDPQDMAGRDGSAIKPTLFVFKDMHQIINGDNAIMVMRYLREIADYLRGRKHNLILLSPTFDVPPDMSKSISVMDWPLPSFDELGMVLGQAEKMLTVDVDIEGRREEIIEAMRGLTIIEAERVLKHGMVATKKLSPAIIEYINREKQQIIGKSKVLEYFPAGVTMDDVGGLSYLKEYSAIKRVAFSKKARAAGVDAPKGLLMVGVPGSGKSLAAKAIAGGVLPLLRMDIGALMGGLVGQSEANMRAALKVAESVSPCIVWLDEIEKGLGSGGGEMDGGTSLRVLATLLTWMQENKYPVYVVATANSINGLRPELLRRFDDVMFVDLPDEIGRRNIFEIHLRRRVPDFKLTPAELGELVTMSWSYSGAEIEKVIKAGLEKAFSQGKPLTAAHLFEAASRIVPLSVTTANQIDAMRTWATSRAIKAGNELEARPEVKTGGGSWNLE